MREIVQRLESECVMRTAIARGNFARFCELNGISITDQPQFDRGISASWREEMGDADRRLIFCARHYDLVPRQGHYRLPNRLLGANSGSRGHRRSHRITAARGAARTGLGGKDAQNEPGIRCQPKEEA
jgi:hypothetical protein